MTAPAGSPKATVSILTATCVAHGLTHMFTILHAPLLLLIGRDFGMGREAIAVYFTVLNACFGLGSIPAGWLGDRLGEKLLLALFFFGCALGGVLIGVATGWPLLATGCVVLGLATSIYHPVGTSLISKGIEKKGLAMGINGIAGSVGTALGPLLASAFSTGTEWRQAYIGLGLGTALLGVGFLFLDLGPAARPAPRGRPVDPGSGVRPGGIRPRLLIIFTLLLVAMTCGGLFYHVYTTTLPAHLTDTGVTVPVEGDGAPAVSTASDESPTPTASAAADDEARGEQEARLGGAMTALVLTFGIVGQLVAGYLSDRRDKLLLYMLNYFLILPSVLLLVWLSGPGLVTMACVGSIFFFAVQPIENTLIADYSPPHWRGAVYGLKFVLVFAVGGLGTWLAASLIQEVPTARVFLLTSPIVVVATIAAILAWLLREKPRAA